MTDQTPNVKWRELLKGVHFRTTTVVLILVWVGLLAFYGFTSAHYNPTDEPREPLFTQQSATPLATTEESSPRSSEPIETTQSTETMTDGTGEPSSPRTSADDPGRRTTPTETTVSVPPSDPPTTSGVDEAP